MWRQPLFAPFSLFTLFTLCVRHGGRRVNAEFEAIEVSDDHLLLTDILEERSITVKQLSLATGRGAATAYKYCAGEATIPSVIWRVLFSLTEDQRILRLITGERPCVAVALNAGPIRLDKPTIENLLTVRQHQLDSERCILEIIADGRVDEQDRKVIERYRRIFHETIGSAYQVYEAINRQFQENGGKHG